MRRGLVLALLALTLVGVAAGCGGGEETSPVADEVEGTLPKEEKVEGDADAGKAVFASAGCGSCHTLADAGSTGTIGPNFDELKPDHELVVTTVTNGKGAMPPFKGQLDEQQLQDVAAYVSSAAGG